MKRRATRGGSLPGDHRASVRVTVVQATGLAAAKSSSKSRAKAKGRDVYALLRIGTIERRTATVKGSLAPRFDEEFEFCAVSREHALLRVALYDADPLTDDRFLGEIIVPVCSLTDADTRPTWRPLEVRPGSTEYVSGELCLSMCCSGADAPARPAMGGARSSLVENATERTTFGSTLFTRPFVISASELTFEAGSPLGQGGFGTVRRGFFRGLEVAIKTLIVRSP